MKIDAKKIVLNRNNEIALEHVEDGSIDIPAESLMAIDGSTTNTGIALLRKVDGAIYYSIAASRDKDETAVQYKIRLKRFLCEVLTRNRNIQNIYYEEPFLGYASASEVLMMLKTSVEELIIENEPKFNYIKHQQINNLKWKRYFLEPVKVPSGSEAQKLAVRNKLLASCPYFATLSQDEIDSIAIGYVCAVKLKAGVEDELKSNKKARPFKYNVQFFGGECNDDFFQEFFNLYNGPKHLLENGIEYTELKGTAVFDKQIYSLMGESDKVLVLRFSSKHFGNIILQYKLGELSEIYPYIYAIVWRSSRKL